MGSGVAGAEALVERSLGFFEERLQPVIAGLGFALPADEAKSPVHDINAVGEPLVGPGKDEGAGEAALKDGGDVLGEKLGLFLLGMADGIHPKFAKDQRLVAREVLQAAEIIDEVFFAMEIDVVTVEIDLAGQQIFRGRKVGVGGEGEGVVAFDDADERVEELFHPPRAVPAHEIGWNLIIDEKTEQGRMTGIGLCRFRNVALNGGDSLAIVEKEHTLVPGNGNHHTQAVALGEIQKPAGRRVINAQDIDPEFAHQQEIEGHALRRGKVRPAFRLRPKRTISDAVQVEFIFAFEEKLGPDLQARQPDRSGRNRVEKVVHGAVSPRGRGAARQEFLGDLLRKALGAAN